MLGVGDAVTECEGREYEDAGRRYSVDGEVRISEAWGAVELIAVEEEI